MVQICFADLIKRGLRPFVTTVLLQETMLS